MWWRYAYMLFATFALNNVSANGRHLGAYIRDERKHPRSFDLDSRWHCFRGAEGLLCSRCNNDGFIDYGYLKMSELVATLAASIMRHNEEETNLIFTQVRSRYMLICLLWHHTDFPSRRSCGSRGANEFHVDSTWTPHDTSPSAREIAAFFSICSAFGSRNTITRYVFKFSRRIRPDQQSSGERCQSYPLPLYYYSSTTYC